MLNPETQTNIGDPKTDTAPIADTISTETIPTSLSQSGQLQQNSNPLNDHDYCSPNKMKTPQQTQSQLGTSNKNSNFNDSAMSTTTTTNDNKTTSDSSNCQTKTLSNNLDDKQRASFSKTYSNQDGADMSDSSLSSSSSSSIKSSVTSTSNLVIAQDQHKPKNLFPQNTPIVKRKPGRPRLDRREVLMYDGSSQDSTSRVRKERQPRQSTSVTDKSQWITGEDELDSALSEHLSDKKPRERRSTSGMKEPDPAFSQYTSSEYSSSDAESNVQDSDDDDNSEDDPNRLWCICQKPHEGKFMICCDVCKDWFHGHCVGVTKLMGDRFEKQGKEWYCGECSEKMRSGIPRHAIPKKLVIKEKKKKGQSSSGKRGRGRPRKSEMSVRDVSTRSLRSSRKSSSSLDPKVGVDNGRLKKNLARADVRSESFDEFQDSQKLKELIRERKKAFFYKRQLAAQQKAARRGELGLGTKQSITANLSDSLDSLATSTSTPNMSNLPINIKEKLKPNIVLQINMKKDSNSDQNISSSRIVTTIVRSPKKKVDTNNPIVNDLFSADPIQINKKIIIKPPSTINSATSASDIFQASSGGDTSTKSSSITTTSMNNNTTNGDSNIRKRSNSNNFSVKKEKHKSDGDQGPSSNKKKRKDSESSLTNGSTSGCGSKHFIKKIKETLESRCQQFSDLNVSSDKIEEIATDIESKLNEFFKEGTPKYRNKFASIVFNLKDPKNQGLAKNVLTEEIEPAKLVNMSPDELASNELARWRERENKHSIELIKRDAEMAAQQVIVKKTHKGEEVISAPVANEPDDPTAAKDNQETPITPNKLSSKDAPPRMDGTKITLTPPVIKPPTIKPIEYELAEAESSEQHSFDRSPYSSSPSSADQPASTSHNKNKQVWSGTIYTPDVGKFSATAKLVSHSSEIEKGDIDENIMVCGRIAHDQVQGYIKKIKSTTKNPISMVQLFPMTDDDKEKFDSLCTYLYSKNRYGVIQTNPQILKDFYVIPIMNNGNLPEVLRSCVKGSGIDRTDVNCLIGLLIKIKKQPGGTSITPNTPVESAAVYTPTIN